MVEQLSLVDFRNYAGAEVTLSAGPTVLVGSNGQGKTNLAEAVGYFAVLGSHRVPGDAPLVRDGADAAVIRERLAHGRRHVQLELQINRRGSNRARVNGTPVRPSELPRYAQVVLFAPEDLQIVRGDPSARRRFADQLLVQRAPRMSGVLADYDRVLRQRTALLKSARARGVRAGGLSTLEVWDEKLVTLGTQIIVARIALAEELQPPLTRGYAAIAGADHGPRLHWSLSVHSLSVHAGGHEAAVSPGASGSADAGAEAADRRHVVPPSGAAEVADAFRAALAAARTAELDRGVTLVGPHRDDLVLEVRGLPVRGYASHGESWSMALGLRLASAELLRGASTLGDPVLILDDVFAELDTDRRARLAGLVAGYEQVIVTAAVGTDVPAGLQAHVLHVHEGRIVGDPAAAPLPDAGPGTSAAAAEGGDGGAGDAR